MTAIAIFAASFIFKTYNNADKHEKDLDMMTELKQTRDEIDNSIDAAKMFCHLILGYDVVKEYADENEKYNNTDFARVTEITNQIAMQEGKFSNYDFSIFIKRPNVDIVIGKRITQSAEECIERCGIDFAEIERRFEQYKTEGFYSAIVNSSLGQERLQLVAKNVYPNGKFLCLGINFYVRDVKVYYDEKSDKIIIYRDSDDIAPDLNDLRASAPLANEVRTISADAEKSVLTTPSIQHDNVIFVQSFKQDGKRFEWIIIVLLIPYLVFVGIISEFIAKRANAPLNKIIENLGVAPSREDDETDVVSKKIAYIKNENAMLNNVAALRYKLIRNHILNDILNGFQIVADSELNNYDLSFLKKKCLVVLMEWQSSDIVISAEMPNEASNVTSYILKYLSECMTDKETIVCAIDDKRILYISANNTRSISNVLSEIDGARRQFKSDITVAAGDWVTGVKALRDMYSQLELGLNNRQIAEGRDIIMIDEIKSFKRPVGYYPLRLEMELSEFVKDGETAKALNILRKMFDYSEIVGADSFNEFRIMISVAIKRILKETEQNENDIFGEKDMFDCILGSENMKTLYATAEEAVGKISDYAAETNKKNIDSLVVQIMKYINDNLYSDISINDVIDEFGISASYLTKLLKNSYNISFKKYVNDARISKAKQIMNDDKTVQIQDVASRVGFNSSVSFIRAFKRIEGITPKQYLDL